MVCCCGRSFRGPASCLGGRLLKVTCRPSWLSLAWLGGANNEGDLGTRTRVGKYSINLACRHMKLQTQRNVLCDDLFEIFFREIESSLGAPQIIIFHCLD